MPLVLAEPREVIADARNQVGEERATFGSTPLGQAAKFSADARAFVSAQQPAAATPLQRAASPRNTLAGGACALTGTALLAWIVLSHMPHRYAISESSPAKTIAVDHGAPLTQSASDTASSPMNVKVDSANAQASTSDDASGKIIISTPALAESTAHDSDYSTAQHRDDLHEKTGELHRAARHSNAKIVASYKAVYAAARKDRIPSAIDSTVATQAWPKPSADGAYSPFVPAQPSDEPYASVKMSAATPVRSVAPPPRSASATESSGTGETDWMSHLSQRRVTDIPDQFSR
ncbi:hypothetical protein [Paraburkholderia sp. BL21I4N1]|uniref:hypothetical protein n=1 Tax=Paraburkholderia sp. BL21I4N1 TaxID=1938801 RepID=UPI0015E2D02C|nr:hypothetical protein [Paraburkholderia sp. BL21I4N1]